MHEPKIFITLNPLHPQGLCAGGRVRVVTELHSVLSKNRTPSGRFTFLSFILTKNKNTVSVVANLVNMLTFTISCSACLTISAVLASSSAFSNLREIVTLWDKCQWAWLCNRAAKTNTKTIHILSSFLDLYIGQSYTECHKKCRFVINFMRYTLWITASVTQESGMSLYIWWRNQLKSRKSIIVHHPSTLADQAHLHGTVTAQHNNTKTAQ